MYGRWRRTLKRLAIRYRKRYAAHHSSVSWDLMIGRNLLFVAQQHGHRILTMLTVYAAAYQRGTLLMKRAFMMQQWGKFCGTPEFQPVPVIGLSQRAA